MTKRICSVDECTKPVTGWGLCPLHYTRWKRHGDPLGKHVYPDPLERLLRRIEINPDTGCWEWQLSTKLGYGQFALNGTVTRQAHRYAYERMVGPVPSGLELDHLCRVRHCVNPEHLEPVTPRVNNLRSTSPSAFNAAKTRCVHGHEFTPENTLLRRDGVSRTCRACLKRSNDENTRRRRDQRTTAGYATPVLADATALC